MVIKFVNIYFSEGGGGGGSGGWGVEKVYVFFFWV